MKQPDNNPKTRVGGMNKVPLHLIPPRALAHVAMAYADGGFKYQPYNWRNEKISSSVYYGATLRHLMTWWEGEDINDSGAHHLAHAVCCLLMILDTIETDLLNDNRPPHTGDYTALLAELAELLPALRNRETTQYDLHDTAYPTKEKV